MIKSIIIGFSSWLFSFFLFSPRLILFLGKGSGTTRRDDILAQCIDPFTKNLKEPILAYRIIQPSIAKALGWCGERRDILALMGSPGIARALCGAVHVLCWHGVPQFPFNLWVCTPAVPTVGGMVKI